MQPPPFYSEFRLDRREYTCICMCACILAMHTCPCACIPRICIDSFLSPPRIRNGLSPLRRLTVSLHPLSSPPTPPAYLPFFVKSTYFALSLSLNVLLSGDASKVTGARVPAARRRIPAGPIHPWGTLPTNPVASVERHAHIHRPSRSAGKLLLSRESQDNFASGSRERGQRNDFLSLDENYL